MTAPLTLALQKFSLNLVGEDWVKSEGDNASFELELPDDDGNIMGSYLITTNQTHSSIEIYVSFSFQNVEGYLDVVKKWIFDVDQNQGL